MLSGILKKQDVESNREHLTSRALAAHSPGQVLSGNRYGTCNEWMRPETLIFRPHNQMHPYEMRLYSLCKNSAKCPLWGGNWRGSCRNSRWGTCRHTCPLSSLSPETEFLGAICGIEGGSRETVTHLAFLEHRETPRQGDERRWALDQGKELKSLERTKMSFFVIRKMSVMSFQVIRHFDSAKRTDDHLIPTFLCQPGARGDWRLVRRLPKDINRETKRPLSSRLFSHPWISRKST